MIFQIKMSFCNFVWELKYILTPFLARNVLFASIIFSQFMLMIYVLLVITKILSDLGRKLSFLRWLLGTLTPIPEMT